MTHTKMLSTATVPRDFLAAIVVLLVALPLCLGIALASNAPLVSGLIAGIVGGILVGALSGSHTSVSGPAAGLTAIVAAQIALLGSFQSFLLALDLSDTSVSVRATIALPDMAQHPRQCSSSAMLRGE